MRGRGGGGGKAPQHTPPAAAASPVLSPGRRRRSGAQAKRLVGPGSPPSGGGRHCPGRQAERIPRPGPAAAPERGGGEGRGSRGKPLSNGHAGSAHTPAAARDSALWRCWRRAAAAPQGSAGSYCPAARIALPLPQPSPPGGWVGMCAVCVCVERAPYRHMQKRGIDRYRHTHRSVCGTARSPRQAVVSPHS